MDLYNIKVDIKNFLRKNHKVLIFLNVFVVVGAFLGCVIAINSDYQKVFETSGNVYFVFLADTSSKGITTSVFVSAIIYLALMVLSKAVRVIRKLGFLLVVYKVYELFYRMIIIARYFGVKAVLPVILVCLAELLFCFALEALYLLNNSEKRNLCKDWISEEYLISVGVIAIVCLVINVVICLLFNLLNFFT
ncbi:MAG: hypothetical protein E7353_08245 [Clostridiales bacterium]|nr:hypothetical protein [Clostridiales bacterium]